MKINHFVLIIFLFCFTSLGYAFEPVSIDEFFKKMPNERPVQPTIAPKENKEEFKKDDVSETTVSQKNLDTEITITAQTYPQIEILLIDRILGRSKKIRFNAGETKTINPIFDVTIFECLERKNQFHNITQMVGMRINGYMDSKKDTQKTILYDDLFYIQSPGFKGFEHPIYDIKPIKCLGKPKPVFLDIQNSTTQIPPVDTKVDKNKNTKNNTNNDIKPNQKNETSDDLIETIISEDSKKKPKTDIKIPPQTDTPLSVPYSVE
jgi:hypothetical protein